MQFRHQHIRSSQLGLLKHACSSNAMSFGLKITHFKYMSVCEMIAESHMRSRYAGSSAWNELPEDLRAVADQLGVAKS